MYRILRASQITLNRHVTQVSGPFAANMRLFEATGMGALLLTDWKENLHELFQPEKEVATYRTAEECVDKLHFYQTHEAERERVASAGQRKTLAAHTYRQRMEELLALLEIRRKP